MDFSNASDTLARLASQHQGLIDAAAALKDLGGLANAKDELTAQLGGLRSDIESAKLDLAAQAELVKEAKDNAMVDMAEIEHAAGIAVDKADADAKEIIDAAQAKAGSLLADATAAAASISNAARTEQGALQLKVLSLRSERDDLSAKNAEAQEALTSLEQKIADTKAALQKLIA